MAEFTDKQQLEIAQQEYVTANIDDDIRIDNKKTLIGKVASFQDNTSGNGEQIYTITPNGTADNPQQVKEVTVLFRGSTAPLSGSDWTTDWFQNDLPMAARILTGGGADPYLSHGSELKRGAPQLETSAQALQEIMDRYPNANINIYAHSLGSMDAQYAMASLSAQDISRVHGAWIYNGPNTYSTLTDEQKKRVDSIKGRIRNYIDHKDFIGLGYDEVGSANAVGIVGHIDSKEVSGGFLQKITAQHMWGGYQFNSRGQILLEKGTEAAYYNDLRKYQLQSAQLQLSDVQGYKVALAAGGYSEHEKIFLDSEQATALATGMESTARSASEQIAAARDRAVEEMETFYDTMKNILLSTCTVLSSVEIDTILAAEGVTRSDMVDPLRSHFDEQAVKAAAISESFSGLSEDIKSGVQEMLERDSQLKEEFNQWTNT